MVLKKIGVISCAKLSGLLYCILGLIFGIIMAFFSSIVAVLGGGSSNAGFFSAMFGIGAIIWMPAFYGALGFIGGAIMAWLYNLLASWIGGVEVEFEEDAHFNQSQPTMP